MFKLNLLSFVDLIINVYTMEKIIVVAILWRNETILLCLIKPQERPSQPLTATLVPHILFKSMITTHLWRLGPSFILKDMGIGQKVLGVWDGQLHWNLGLLQIL